ncbi:hypothetical protein BGX28_006065 [Mortierella sp. GBA30]|nr:hypothetical protein BGX28_006065 [Mortierella sp. GBA30]
MSDCNEDNKAVSALALPEIVDTIASHVKIKRHMAKASLVCRAWSVAWTRPIWRNMDLDRKKGPIPESLPLYGPIIRSLTYDNAKDEHLDRVLPHCQNLQCLNLQTSKATVETLAPHLEDHLSKTLRWLELDTLVIEAMDVVPVLTDYCHNLEHLNLMFPDFKAKSALPFKMLTQLLDACQNLRELELSDVDINTIGCEEITIQIPQTVSWNSENGREVMTVAVEATSKPSVHQRLRLLTLESAHITDLILLKLLSICPNLNTIYISTNSSLTESSIVRIPELCPEVNDLCLASCSSVSPTAYVSLFLPPIYMHSPLALRCIDLSFSGVDDLAITMMAQTQEGTLEFIRLQDCDRVTDRGLEDVLKHCRRLTSLSISGTSGTAAIMKGPKERWSCYKTLECLDIRKIGVVDMERIYADDDPRIERNKEAFVHIKRRVEMLPNLRNLAVSVHGLHEELIQGFGHGHRHHHSDQDKKELLTSVHIDGKCMGVVIPPIQTLNVRGMVVRGFSDDEIDRFVENYPFLRCIVINKSMDGCYPWSMRKLWFEGVKIVLGEFSTS